MSQGGVFFTGQETYGTAVVVAASINFTRGVVFHGEKTYGTPMLASASRPLCPLAQISRGGGVFHRRTNICDTLGGRAAMAATRSI